MVSATLPRASTDSNGPVTFAMSALLLRLVYVVTEEDIFPSHFECAGAFFPDCALRCVEGLPADNAHAEGVSDGLLFWSVGICRHSVGPDGGGWSVSII